METFLQLVMIVFVFSSLVSFVSLQRKRKNIEDIIQKWKKNPTKMDLSLATTKQIVNELQVRSQPIILILPEMPKVKGKPVKNIQLYVLGIRPTDARMILHGVDGLLSQTSNLPMAPPSNENEDPIEP